MAHATHYCPSTGPNDQNSDRGIETIRRLSISVSRRMSPNDQNSDRGIETFTRLPKHILLISPNDQNSDRGIETI